MEESFDERMSRVEALLREVETNADAPTLDRVRELVSTVIELHTVALEKLLTPIARTAEGSAMVRKVRAEEPLVESVLELHGLNDLAPATTEPLIQLRLPKKIETASTPTPTPTSTSDHCESCASPIASDHSHFLDVRREEARPLVCVCEPCAVAGMPGHVRVPKRYLELQAFRLDDPTWASLGIPVQAAFLVRPSSREERRARGAVAYYPSPGGAVEAVVDAEAWADLARDNPVLATLERDVEALLIYRGRRERAHFIVPIDAGYRMVGMLRAHGPGAVVSARAHRDIEALLDEMRERSEARP